MSREHLPCVFLSQTKIVKKNARKTTPIGRKNNLNEKKKWQVAPPIVRRLSQGVGASVQERVVGLLAGIRNTVLQGGSVARLGSSLGAAGYSCRPDDTSVGGAGRELPVPLCIDTTWAPPPPSLVPLPLGRTRRPAPPSSNTHLPQSQIPLSPVPRLTWEERTQLLSAYSFQLELVPNICGCLLQIPFGPYYQQSLLSA